MKTYAGGVIVYIHLHECDMREGWSYGDVVEEGAHLLAGRVPLLRRRHNTVLGSQKTLMK